MDHLAIPDEFPGASVEGQKAVTVQVLAGTVSTVEVVLRLAVGIKTMPRFSSTAIPLQAFAPPTVFHASFWPGFVTGPARMGNGREGPCQLVCEHVVGADIAGTRSVFFVGC